MAEAFATTPEKVLITGQPRCDLLFEPTDWFNNNGIDKSRFRMTGIWLPTYRKSIVGDIRVDGESNDHGVSFLDESDLRKLDSLLKAENILLLVKIHPMDALQNVSFEDFSNLLFIKPKDFRSQLYPLLGECDFLLTDYSSVYIDYQILRRPIGFVMSDVKSYKLSRGLYFEDIENDLPGPILSDFDKLREFIKSPYVVKNEVAYNDFYDNESSRRICEFLRLN